MTAGTGALRQLALSHGVQTWYQDTVGVRRSATPDALLAVLRALGAPVETMADAGGALRQRQVEIESQALEPVMVLWDGRPGAGPLRLPATVAGRVGARGPLLQCRLDLEQGGERRWEVRLPATQPHLTLQLPAGLPQGRHRLHVEGPGLAARSLVLAARSRFFTATSAVARRGWGLFAPLHGLRSGDGRGCGDLGDLAAMARWTGEAGGQSVATLPLLPTFVDGPAAEPSPYAPVSRLFWGELYADLDAAPELPDCPEARTLLACSRQSLSVAPARLAGCGQGTAVGEVDYAAVMQVRRTVLAALARQFYAAGGDRGREFRDFAAARPHLQDYARFRAVMELRGDTWPEWPGRLRDGELSSGDSSAEAERYHIYAQWLLYRQFLSLSRSGGAASLYLDLPLGVHPWGYDAWRLRHLFVPLATGAPPDNFFGAGQNWGFPPPHPERSREDGYAYLAACVRHHLEVAGRLRLDHVMGLHRLFCIPTGKEAADGVYVRYPAHELYAVMSLESHRLQGEIVGEDLGTVPRFVRTSLDRHRLQRMYVLQMEAGGGGPAPLGRVPAGSVASLNTHDMYPFAAFWRGLDIAQRLALGLLDRAGAGRERRHRVHLRRALAAQLRLQGYLPAGRQGARLILDACLSWLAAGPARLVLITLDDLWLETLPQNVPGTLAGNWTRRARHTFAELQCLPAVQRTLAQVDHLRRHPSSSERGVR